MPSVIDQSPLGLASSGCESIRRGLNSTKARPRVVGCTWERSPNMLKGWLSEGALGKLTTDVRIPRNELMVSLLALLLAATFLQSARAALWKTEAQLTAEYGEPVEIRRHSDRRTFTYQIGDLKLEVEFLYGISQNILYTHEDRTKPFSSEEIESLLRADFEGKIWQRTDQNTWEVAVPPARATVRKWDSSSSSNDGKENRETSYLLEVTTVAYEAKQAAKTMALFVTSSRTGAQKRFQGVLEFKDEEDDSRVAIVRDGKSVLEISWAWRNYPGKVKLESGETYQITLRDEELIDLDVSGAFVSDRVHKSHHARVIDSEFFTLVRIKHAEEVVYDESVCEVHKTSMQRVKAEIGYGMYGPASKADAVCDKEYPHHADWIRGGCLVGDLKSALHYICPECVAATAKYKREHPEETSEE